MLGIDPTFLQYDATTSFTSNFLYNLLRSLEGSGRFCKRKWIYGLRGIICKERI